MSEIVDTIRRVAAFAETKDSDTFSIADVHFRTGAVFAQSMLGGATEPIDLELNCGVGAKRLLKALQAVGKDPSFAMDGKVLLIKSGRSTVKLETSDPKDAPKFHQPPKGAQWVPIPLLHEAHRLAWACSTDATRTHIAGVCLTASGLCATNGHVAVKLGSENYCELLGVPPSSAPIVPPAVLKGLTDPTFGVLDKGRLFLAAEDKPKAFRSAHLYDASFPPMENILKGGRAQERMTLDRAGFIDLLKRAKLSAPSAVLEVKGQRLSISIDDTRPQDTLFAFADSVEFVNATKDKVPNGLVSLNLGYLLPAVETCPSAEFELGMVPDPQGSLEPVYAVDGDLEAIMMPERL
jgi:hypothetical protein